jgi:hypothetical protein
MIIPKNHGSRHECSGSLRQRVRYDLAPGKSAENSQGNGYSGVQVRSGNLACHVNAHRDSETPTQSNVGEAAMNRFSRIVRRKQNDHRHNPGAKQNEHKRPEKFRDEFSHQSRF